MLYKLKSKTSIEFWVILTLFIIGLLIRLYRLGIPSLSDDEVFTATWINHSFLDTIRLVRHWEFPPLYFGILNLWVRAFGNGEWALRFPSAIFSSLTVIVIYKLGKELISKDVGLISASLLIFSQFALLHAQNAKMYSLFWFLAAVSFLFFFRFLKEHRKSSYRFYIIVSILSCYTMYTGFLLLVTQSIIFLLMGERTRWRKWFTGQLIIISFCIPWMIYFLCSKHEIFPVLRPPGTAFDYFTFLLKSFQLIIGSVREDWGQFSVDLCLWAVNVFLYAFLITFLLIDVLIISYKNKKIGLSLPMNYYCLFLWIIVSIFIYFMFDCFFSVDLQARYIGFLQIPIILLASSQINNFHGVIKRMLVLALVVIAMNNACFILGGNFKDIPQGWRTTAEELTQDLKKNDIVFLSFIDIDMFKYYYKGDTRRFFRLSWRKDLSSELEFLEKKGIFTEHVHSIFILYRNNEQLASEIKIGGFSLDYKFLNSGMGFLHFQRTQSKSNFGK